MKRIYTRYRIVSGILAIMLSIPLFTLHSFATEGNPQADAVDTPSSETETPALEDSLEENNEDIKNIGISNFTKNITYFDGQFLDVPSTEWYADSVKAAFEYQLMVGDGARFNPTGSISIAEAITIASRLHDIYYGNQYLFQSGSPWYQSYVDYALENQIIAESYTDYEASITRSEFAVIMTNVFPLNPINNVEDGAIPDISKESSYYDSVYYLYRAGIISGTNSIGTFNPDATISRAEVSVILSSMVDEGLRKTFTLKAPILPASITVISSAVVPIGQTRKLSTTISPSNANAGLSITWSSSDPSIASVDGNGVVTGKTRGIANITATTVNGKNATCVVAVESMENLDIFFARDAISRLKSQLKFPDTLEVFEIWAFSFKEENSAHMVIYIYYSALNSIGLQSRNECSVYYEMDTMTYKFTSFEGKKLSHYEGIDRVVDIEKVLGS